VGIIKKIGDERGILMVVKSMVKKGALASKL